MVRTLRTALRRDLALLLLPLTAACAAVPSAQPATVQAPTRTSAVPPTNPAPPGRQAFRAPVIQRLPGLESVIERNAAALARQFGKPQLDVHEGDMRKLQFGGEPCVLDIYLYPLHPGGEPVATFVDARRATDGLEVDRASCVAALVRP
jgi:hypothetical protein